MKIDHIALYVHDLEGMKLFYEKYFGGVAGVIYHNPKTNFKSYFLTFGDNASLELITRPEVTKIDKKQFNSGFIHLAFSVGTANNVNLLTEQLNADGFRIFSNPRVTGDGCYESCIIDPEGNYIEITQ